MRPSAGRGVRGLPIAEPNAFLSPQRSCAWFPVDLQTDKCACPHERLGRITYLSPCGPRMGTCLSPCGHSTARDKKSSRLRLVSAMKLAPNHQVERMFGRGRQTIRSPVTFDSHTQRRDAFDTSALGFAASRTPDRMADDETYLLPLAFPELRIRP